MEDGRQVDRRGAALLLAAGLAASALFCAGIRADKERISAAITAAGLDPAVRGEKLGIEEFANLTKKMININLKTEDHHV